MLLTPDRATRRLCVYQVGKRSKHTLWQRAKERFWNNFFPWFSRKVLYRHAYCVADGCMHWHFVDKEHGYCDYCTFAARHALLELELMNRKRPQSG
jgi:hypothetical protein